MHFNSRLHSISWINKIDHVKFQISSLVAFTIQHKFRGFDDRFALPASWVWYAIPRLSRLGQLLTPASVTVGVNGCQRQPLRIRSFVNIWFLRYTYTVTCNNSLPCIHWGVEEVQKRRGKMADYLMIRFQSGGLVIRRQLVDVFAKKRVLHNQSKLFVRFGTWSNK